jgi:parallel beta-helix repeat protein
MSPPITPRTSPPRPIGTLLCVGAAALLLCASEVRAQDSAGRASPGSSDTLFVAAPTGEREADRASILAALEDARDGNVLRFATGTYLVGEVIRIATPGLTLLGHQEGTVLRGCELDEYRAAEREIVEAEGGFAREAISRCGTFELTGGGVTVRGLTFEQTRAGLMLGCCHMEPRFEVTSGGYLIEDNVFRNSLNGIRPWITEPSVIRGNRFINTFHAISGVGSHLHVLDNDISVPDPSAVPGVGHPSFAIALGPLPGPAAAALGLEENGQGIVIAGNRIEGHPDGIYVPVYPGSSFRNNEIRGNTIRVARVPIPPDGARSYIVDVTAPSDSTIVGIPIALYARSGVAGPEDDEVEAGWFEDNRIEGNRIIGAEGVGIALQRGRGNRIADNDIRGIGFREPFPGNTVLSSSELWREANGSGIWFSPGSDGNEIVGNSFEGIAGDAVVLEGNGNRVEVRHPRGLDILHARLDSIRRAGNVPAAQVAVILPDTTVFWNFGMANPESPVTDSTMFRAGSVSKSFAGLAMLMLVERGLVSLDDPLAELAPELPIRNPWRATHPVRLSHLLEAGAGFVGFHQLERTPAPTDTDLQNFLEGLPFRLDVQWRPGDHTAYHNLGPVITAYLIEKITGEQYENFVRENLFGPLGMGDASYLASPTVMRRLAWPPRRDGDVSGAGALPDTLQYEHIGGFWPSGGLSTSARELAALVRMLLDRGTFNGRRLLTPESVLRFETPTSTLAARELGIPLGHGINNWTSSFRGIRYHGHGGRTDGRGTGFRGYANYYAYAPEHGTGFVFMSTVGSSGEELHYPVMSAVLSHLHPDEPSPAGLTSAEETGDVAGCYVLANPASLGARLGRWSITVENGVVSIDDTWRLERTGLAGVFRVRGDEGGPRRGRPDDTLVAFITDEDHGLVMQHLDHPWEAAVRVPCR